MNNDTPQSSRETLLPGDLRPADLRPADLRPADLRRDKTSV
jgi:hypothetical protein